MISHISIVADCQQDFPIGLYLNYTQEEYDGDEILVWQYYRTYNVTDWVNAETVTVEYFFNFAFDYRSDVRFPDQFLSDPGYAQLWVDRESWEVDHFVTINQIQYQIRSDSFIWVDQTGSFDCYYLEHILDDGEFVFVIDLYYDLESGILVQRREMLWNPHNSSDGYTSVAELAGHNLNRYTAFEPVFASPSIFDLISGFYGIGIVVELAIVVFFVRHRGKTQDGNH